MATDPKEQGRAGRRRAVALKYDGSRDSAPRIAAKGQGKLAERIIELARQHGVPIKEEPSLVEILSRLDLNQEIPPETYVVVARILAWAYQLNGKTP